MPVNICAGGDHRTVKFCYPLGEGMGVFWNVRQDVSIRKRLIIVVVLLGSLFSGQGWSADSGMALAEALNKAYQQTSNVSCGKEQLASLWCSGVLARPVTTSFADSIASDAAFLRKDTIQNISQPLSGVALAFVLPDAPQPDATPAMTAWCALAEGLGANPTGSAHRCWPTGKEYEVHAQDTDPSSCATLLPSGNVSLAVWQGWHSDQSGRLCSFSTESALEFETVLKASASLKKVAGIIMPAWSITDAGKLTTKALIYPEGNTQALKEAQNLRNTWVLRAGTLNILAYNPTSGFSYKAQDNPDVQPIADRDGLRIKLGEYLNSNQSAMYFVPAELAVNSYKPIFKNGNSKADFNEPQFKYLTFRVDKNSEELVTSGYRDEARSAFSPGSYGSYGVFFSEDDNIPVVVFYLPRSGDTSRLKQNALAIQQLYKEHGKDLPLVYSLYNFPAKRINLDDFFILDSDPQDTQPDFNSNETVADVVARLSKRMINTVDDCGKDNKGQAIPAYMCSGLVVRRTDAAASHAMTMPPAALRRNVASFSFIRADTHTSRIYMTDQGVILKPNARLLSFFARCNYPMDADTANDGRPRDNNLNRCGLAAESVSNKDYSSCLNVLHMPPSATANDWVTAYQKKFPNYFGDFAQQCSFSVHDAAQFLASVMIEGTLLNRGQSTFPYSEMVLAPWTGECNGPEIEAFWYGAEGNKKAAQGYAAEYSQACNKHVQAVRFNFTNNTITVSAN